jgi:ketosteroid isomerase-like protein
VAALAAPCAAQSREAEVNAVLDDWHAAAAAADEKRYFGHLAEDSIFLGTDATERWTKKQFHDYAKPFFDRGRAWSFRAVRRDVIFSKDGSLAWFDEDLATPNLGPCRGSGVLRRDGGTWKIVHYNLTLTIPNEVVDDVKKLVETRSATSP